MKPYGLPRVKEVEAPDLVDIQTYGLRSSAGNLPGKGGEIRSLFKNSRKKRNIRRYWKKRERKIIKEKLNGDLK